MAKRRWKMDDIKSIVAGDNPFLQVSFSDAITLNERKEGSIWEDSRGNKWQKKNGYKVKVPKNDASIRMLIKRTCSECKLDLDVFGNKLDDKMYARTGKCYECVEKEEMVMRVTGDFKPYEEMKLAKNKLSMLRELKRNLIESEEYLKKDDCKLEFVNSDGKIEVWTGAQNSDLLQDVKDDLVKTENEIKITEELISGYEAVLNKS